ncbi:MAG: hypothetical protein NT038_10930 [Euryarchaeota archaeon]|nr:hypothetical protein [Euryarchaeota archaeon]
MENKAKIFGNAGNSKIRALAVVPIALAIVFMLVVGPTLSTQQNATVVKNQLAPEEHCQVCDYLKTLYDGSGDSFTYNMTREQYVAKYGYGGEGARQFYQAAKAYMPYCDGASNPIDAIISEYEATQSLDNFFAPIYSYGIPISGSSEISISQAIPSQHSGRILFDATPIGGGGIGGTQITGKDGISQVVVKTHYTYEDLGMTYAEIYQRALVMKAWLEEGGPAPTWMSETDMEKTNAELDCIEAGMIVAGTAKCVILPIVLLAPLMFGGAFILKVIQVLSNFPELIGRAIGLYNACVALDSAFRAAVGLPP